MGVTAAAKAPVCFSPNVFALQAVSPDILNQLGLLLREFTPTQARVLLGVLMKKNVMAKIGYQLGQPVFFRLFTNDFISNYYKGYVIGVSTYPTQEVYVTSDLNKRQVGKPAIVALSPESVFSKTKFNAVKVRLAREGKLIDPNHPEKKLFEKSKKPVDVGYEPPTLYTAKASWYTVYQRSINKDLRPLDEQGVKARKGKKKGANTKFTFKQGR